VWRAGLVSFSWQPASEPVRLTGGVAENFVEAKAFEPPRGPRAQVSLIVMTVDDHRPIPFKLRCSLSIQLL
jgi:hypothetical protein